MKRDLDLVRKIMESLEMIPAGAPVTTFNVEVEADATTVLEHLALMINAGLLEGESWPNAEMPDGGNFFIERITWSGHDFLDSARSEEVWQKTKARLKSAGGWTFALVLELLKDEAKKLAGPFLP